MLVNVILVTKLFTINWKSAPNFGLSLEYSVNCCHNGTISEKLSLGTNSNLRNTILMLK